MLVSSPTHGKQARARSSPHRRSSLFRHPVLFEPFPRPDTRGSRAKRVRRPSAFMDQAMRGGFKAPARAAVGNLVAFFERRTLNWGKGIDVIVSHVAETRDYTATVVERKGHDELTRSRALASCDHCISTSTTANLLRYAVTRGLPAAAHRSRFTSPCSKAVRGCRRKAGRPKLPLHLTSPSSQRATRWHRGEPSPVRAPSYPSRWPPCDHRPPRPSSRRRGSRSPSARLPTPGSHLNEASAPSCHAHAAAPDHDRRHPRPPTNDPSPG